MKQAYDDEDNAPMFGDLPIPYPVRTWEEMIKAWEVKYNADGQGQISGGLEANRLIEEAKRGLEVRKLRDAVPEAGRTVRYAQEDIDGSTSEPHAGRLQA